MVGFRSAKFFSPPGRSAVTIDADGRDQDRDHLQRGQMIAEKHETEDRGLDRLGLQIRRRHHERAVVHRQQHQSGGDDLAQRAEQQPRPERRRWPRHVVAGRDHHHGKEHQRERKAEQEADIGGAPGAERPGQLPLHRVARDLPERGDDGKGNPERGDAEHGGDSVGGRGMASHRAGRGWRGQPERIMTGLRTDLVQRGARAPRTTNRVYTALRHHHVIDVHVGRQAPAVGERAVDHAGLLGDGELVVLQMLRQFVGGDELVPLMGAARQPAQHIFGADDGKRKALPVAVQGRDHHHARRA